MKDFEDDDLRTFIDNYNKAKPQEDSTEIEDQKYAPKETDEVEKFASALDISNDVRELMARVEKLEVLNYGLWLMLEKKGFTHEEYNEALATAKENIAAKHTSTKEAIACPNCGRLLQSADIFGIKCIYCGYEQVANPYQTVNPAKEAEEKAAEEAAPIQEFEAYDVTKDLGFDEE